MTKKHFDTRGPAFATGGLRRPREDLVAWPTESGGVPSETTRISIDHDEDEDVNAQLARAKQEIRKLLTRVQELSEENERLRLAAGPASKR